MWIRGKWYSETETEAYIAELESRIAELEGKHLSECAQISEYDIENRAFKEENKKLKGTLVRPAMRVVYEADGYDDDGNLIYDTAYCPNCGQKYEVDYDDHDNYCRNCGQELDWSTEEV